MPFPPTTPVVLPPAPVGMGKAVELKESVMGRPNGSPSGVMVLFAMTILGAVAETGTDVIVDEPLKVAVRVVKTSDKVVVLSGTLDAVGFTVGARVVDMAAKPTLL